MIKLSILNEIQQILILRSSTFNKEHVETKIIKFGPAITREIGLILEENFCQAPVFQICKLARVGAILNQIFSNLIWYIL